LRSQPVRAFAYRDQFGAKGAFDALKIRVRLPDGRLYGETGKLDFVNNTISEGTDPLLFREVIPNPVLGPGMVLVGRSLRELSPGEFVTVLLESVESRQVITMPRAGLLADQQGPYVYVALRERTFK
jgi:membrane fusion protein (multidrug efflux system)